MEASLQGRARADSKAGVEAEAAYEGVQSPKALVACCELMPSQCTRQPLSLIPGMRVIHCRRGRQRLAQGHIKQWMRDRRISLWSCDGRGRVIIGTMHGFPSPTGGHTLDHSLQYSLKVRISLPTAGKQAQRGDRHYLRPHRGEMSKSVRQQARLQAGTRGMGNG